MQGVNDFEDYKTIIIVGRLQPPPIEIEAKARCLFGDNDQPFETSAGGGLLAGQSNILMQNGERIPASKQTHSDSRVQALLEQTRELGSLQAIARLRLVAPQIPKRVVVLGSTPLPRFPVSTLTSFATVTAGLDNEADPAGYKRMEDALLTHGRRPVRGVRVSAAGLFSDLPRDFDSLSAAKGFRRGRDTPALCALIQRISAANGWVVTILELTADNGGCRLPACVFGPPSQAVQLARSLWPDLTAQIIYKLRPKKSGNLSVT
ncbi:MAG: hypothetical protein ACI80I_001264 [Akkermansiaceae bacterium]|jgi:hypothetical protein